MPEDATGAPDRRVTLDPLGGAVDDTDDRCTTQLDLGRLPSPIMPEWLSPDAPSLALPFGDHSFDQAIVGREVLAQVDVRKLLRELRRVISPGGEISIRVPGEDRARADDSPSIAALLVEALSTLDLVSVKALDGFTTLNAANREATPTVSREVLVSIAAALYGEHAAMERVGQERTEAILALQQQVNELDRDLQRTSTELAQRRDDVAKMAVRIREQRLLFAGQARRLEDLAGSLAMLKASKRSLETAQERSISDLRAARGEVSRLQSEVRKLTSQIAHERWRAEVGEKRKWTRIGEQVKRLRRVWTTPAVAYQVIQIVAKPTLAPKAPELPELRAGEFQPSGGEQAGTGKWFPELPFPSPRARRDVRVASILDEFSELAFQYEFHLVRVPRHGWRKLFEDELPDVLLVESAWNGNGGEWQYALAGSSAPREEVRDLIRYCRDRGIPTVFWNKEDPLEYDVFLNTAREFDWVFTVDENCVARYRADLGHERVEVMPFAVQPMIHNPIDAFKPRKHGVAFAGTYYSTKYPERKEQIQNLLVPCADLGLDIFSRWESNPRYAFPEPLNRAVAGSLSYAQTLTAYRSYKVFLNVNSVPDSKTMFSRRVLELLASGTPVVSGPSPGMSSMLGDAVVHESWDPETTRHMVRALLRSRELRDRRAVRGIRAVMKGNTYSDRADHILATLGLRTTPIRNRVSIVAPTNRRGAYPQILENVGRQDHDDIELIIALHGVDEDEGALLQSAAERGISSVKVLQAPSAWSLGRVLNEACEMATGDYIAKMDDDDFYGEKYLSDQLLAFRYTDADIVGKWSRYVYLESEPCLGVIFPGHEHRYTELVGGGTILFKRDVLDAVTFPDRSVGEDTQFLRECAAVGFRTYSTDRFNFVYVRHDDMSRHTYKLRDLEHMSHTEIVSYGRSFDHVVV